MNPPYFVTVSTYHDQKKCHDLLRLPRTDTMYHEKPTDEEALKVSSCGCPARIVRKSWEMEKKA